jgi:predicted nicotinamide N-methyase
VNYLQANRASCKTATRYNGCALRNAGLEESDPYWSDVWDSAVAMAEAMFLKPGLVEGKRVADVGCGLGLGGVAAALAGVRRCTVDNSTQVGFAMPGCSRATSFKQTWICLQAQLR